MKQLKQTIAIGCLGTGLIFSSMLATSASAYPQYSAQPGEGYYREHPDLRQLVDQTQNDLRTSKELNHEKGKQDARYKNAQQSLSTLDRHLTKGKYHKSDMDKAIEDIQNVLDHNTLQGTSRDALLSDVQNLRMARKAR